MSNETPHDAAAAEGLVAGPEMDAEVARVVFGEPVEVMGGVTRLIRDFGRPPLYSSDMGAAWKVVEQAIDYQLASCGMVDHSKPIAESEDHMHRAELWFGKRGREFAKYGLGFGSTLPEAICRSALLALEGHDARTL